MVLQSQTYPGGYEHQSYSHSNYYSTGYGNGQNMHMGPIPSFGSPHMTPSDFPHTMPFTDHGTQHYCQSTPYYNSSTDRYSHGLCGLMPSPHSVAPSFGPRIPVGGHASYVPGETHGPMGSNVETVKYVYSGYGNGRPSMYYNPMHGGRHPDVWKLKSVDDDD